jgi:hypothetical protein
MAVNENGNLLDDAGNVAVDFVWGNLPLAPNDERLENGGALLDATLDSHEIAYQGWNGYPLYTENTAGAERRPCCEASVRRKSAHWTLPRRVRRGQDGSGEGGS